MNKENKKRLNELHINSKPRTEFSMPLNMMPPYKNSDNSSNGLTKCIVDFLNWNGHFAERTNTMGRVLDNRKTVIDVVGRARTIGSTKYIPTTGVKGSSDIKATINGRMVAIEVKYKKDKQSDAQKEYQELIEKAKGVYYIAKDFDSFVEWYDNYINSELF